MTLDHLILNAQRHGLSLYAHGSQLDISGDKVAIERLLPEIKAHKTEIINYLQSIPTDPLVKPCPICAGVDFIHGDKGGYFCTTCQPNARPGTLVRAGGTRRQEQPTRVLAPVPAVKERPTLPGKEWTDRHHAELVAAGWTDKELYKGNYPLAGGPIWKRTGLKVALMRDGRVVFSYQNPTGVQITQTAWPRAGRNKKETRQ